MFLEQLHIEKLQKIIANLITFEYILYLSKVFRSICNKYTDDVVMICVLSKEQKKNKNKKRAIIHNIL